MLQKNITLINEYAAVMTVVTTICSLIFIPIYMYLLT